MVIHLVFSYKYDTTYCFNNLLKFIVMVSQRLFCFVFIIMVVKTFLKLAAADSATDRNLSRNATKICGNALESGCAAAKNIGATVDQNLLTDIKEMDKKLSQT